ncbi:MAG: hypothetical protein WBV85_06590 [Solirubrobacteraceae bacterium]
MRRSAPAEEAHDHGHSDHDENHHTQGAEHGHFHGLIHDSIKRSRQGIRAISLSLAVLGLTAIAQTLVFIASGSIALLADLIHNFGDALTAVPLGLAFALHSQLHRQRRPSRARLRQRNDGADIRTLDPGERCRAQPRRTRGRVPVAPGARSYFNEHLLLADLNTGQSWTIGAGARVCHRISAPSWNARGTSLIFTYAPSDPAVRVGKRDGYGLCSDPIEGVIVILSATHPADLASAQIVKPARGCSYLSAVFDPEGIAATEACEHGALREFSFPGRANGSLASISANGRHLAVHKPRHPRTIRATSRAIREC